MYKLLLITLVCFINTSLSAQGLTVEESIDLIEEAPVRLEKKGRYYKIHSVQLDKNLKIYKHCLVTTDSNFIYIRSTVETRKKLMIHKRTGTVYLVRPTGLDPLNKYKFERL